MLWHGWFGLLRRRGIGRLRLGALRAGDIDGAVAMLSRARLGYSAVFLIGLAVHAPKLAIRTAWRLFVLRQK